MSMQLNVRPGSKVLEIGGGACPRFHPNIDIRQCKDQQGRNTVDIVHDLEQFPWPLKDSEWDGIFSHFCLEHCSWRLVSNFLRECFRIAKPGAKAIFVIPNTEAQLQHVLRKSEWDDDEGSMIFGGQDYGENSHKSAFSPRTVIRFLQDAGFNRIVVSPYGHPLYTDLFVEATKPEETPVEELKNEVKLVAAREAYNGPNTSKLTTEQRARLFDRTYFDPSYCGSGCFLLDYPQNEVIARKIMALKPESVLELGAARGYVGKRLEDNRIQYLGLDISKHCYLTRASNNVILQDICLGWFRDEDGRLKDKEKDLCFSKDFLTHVPEELLPQVFKEMERTCKRGLHAVVYPDQEDGLDETRSTIRDRAWWIERLPQGHEVTSRAELERGQFPPEVASGSGRICYNLGSFMSMYHHGYINVDIHNLHEFAQANGYRYLQHDLRNGVPALTGTVDAFMLNHVLEHFSRVEGLSMLRDMRRCIKPGGVVRILVPNAELLTQMYKEDRLGEFDELSSGIAEATSQSAKLWESLCEGHRMTFDLFTLCEVLREAGFEPFPTRFRETRLGERGKVVLRETQDMIPCLSLVVEAVPKLA